MGSRAYLAPRAFLAGPASLALEVMWATPAGEDHTELMESTEFPVLRGKEVQWAMMVFLEKRGR